MHILQVFKRVNCANHKMAYVTYQVVNIALYKHEKWSLLMSLIGKYARAFVIYEIILYEQRVAFKIIPVIMTCFQVHLTREVYILNLLNM